MSIHKYSLSKMPSVRQLRALVAIFRTGSVSAAARELSLTQPAVTVLVRELEGRLGIQLFDRSTRSMRPTDAGLRALEYARRALTEMEDLTTSMNELAGLNAGRVRVAATATTAQFFLPPVMRRFLATYPNVNLEIEEVAPSDFVAAIEGNRADFGVGTLDAPITGLQQTPLLKETLVAAALPSKHFPNGRPMTWKQLSLLPLVAVRPGYGIRERIDTAARESGVQLRVEHEVSLLSTAIGLAAHGLGVVVVPPSIVATDDRFATRRLIRPTVERVIGVHSQRGRSLSPASTAFLEVLSQSTQSN